MKKIVPKNGMRVNVFSANQKRHLGMGTIGGVGRFKPVGGGEFDVALLKIELDNGMVRYGPTCWWYPKDDLEHCPWCKKPAEIHQASWTGIDYVRCPNKKCPVKPNTYNDRNMKNDKELSFLQVRLKNIRRWNRCSVRAGAKNK